MTKLKKSEEIPILVFDGIRERVVIGQDPRDGQWVMAYCRAGQDVSDPQACIRENIRTRAEIVQRTVTFAGWGYQRFTNGWAGARSCPRVATGSFGLRC
jgi:hypothetical protein